jgi:SAM-dependent methyltransferase
LSDQDRIPLFDRWAARYDRQLDDPRGIHEGYDEVLELVVRRADPHPGMDVLDLGVGTGNLAQRFRERGCALWCVDFSPAMLARARGKLPGARFFEVDLRDEWPAALDGPFDRIVSTYVFHEFDLQTKVHLLADRAGPRLRPGGWIVVGDVSFPNRDALLSAGADRWDEDEYYWAADEALAALAGAGLSARYTQVSVCGGVYRIVPAPARAAR